MTGKWTQKVVNKQVKTQDTASTIGVTAKPLVEASLSAVLPAMHSTSSNSMKCKAYKIKASTTANQWKALIMMMPWQQ